MGRIVTLTTIKNVKHPDNFLRCDAIVDTGAAFMVLPTAWKERLGELESIEKVELKTATQATITGEICGPVQIQVECFRPIYNEVLFVEMESKNGFYEPLIGYIVLEQAQIVVDMIGHRLIHLNKIDLK